MNLLEELLNRGAVRFDREYGQGAADDDWRMHEGQYLGPYLADVLDIMTAEGRMAPAVEPGACWHDSGVVWPSGERPRCELKAGHAGAHEWKRPNGGEAVWLETEPATHPDTQHGQEESE